MADEIGIDFLCDAYETALHVIGEFRFHLFDRHGQIHFSSRRYDLCYAVCEISLRSKHDIGLTEALMKTAMARIKRKYCLLIFSVLLSVFSLASPLPASSVAQNQDCSSNCESHKRLATFSHTKASEVRTRSFTSSYPIGVVQSADLAGGIDVQAAVSGSTPSNTDPGSARAQALRNPVIDAGNAPGPRFFLLIGLALIGARLIISYRSRKVKNLATGTH